MVVCDLDIRIIQDFYKEVVGNLGLNLKKFKRKLSTALHARRVSFDLNGRTSSPLSLRRQGMKQFEVLLGKIRTAEVRDAIASVRAWCGRGMLVLSILIGVAILGVAAVAVVLDSLSKTTDYQLTVLDEMRIQNVIQDAELESLAELRILWDEHEQLAPTPTPAPTPVPTPATVSPANWVEVADCDVEAVAFRIAEGTVTEEWQ